MECLLPPPNDPKHFDKTSENERKILTAFFERNKNIKKFVATPTGCRWDFEVTNNDGVFFLVEAKIRTCNSFSFKDTALRKSKVDGILEKIPPHLPVYAMIFFKNDKVMCFNLRKTPDRKGDLYTQETNNGIQPKKWIPHYFYDVKDDLLRDF